MCQKIEAVLGVWRELDLELGYPAEKSLPAVLDEQEFRVRYDISGLSARMSDPIDRASVEGKVREIERLQADIRITDFFDFE